MKIAPLFLVSALATTSASLSIAVLLAILGASANASSLVANGSFESPTASACNNGSAICRGNGVNSTWSAGQNMGGWVVATSSVDLFNNLFANAADGSQFVDLQGDYGYNGGVYQDISTVAGDRYLLKFAMSAMSTCYGSIYGPNGDKTASVTWGETRSDFTLSPSSDGCTSTPFPISWTDFELVVTATGNTTRLMFSDNMNWNTAYGMALDDISLERISEVPLPRTLGLLGIGLAGLGLVRRKAKA